MRRPFLDAVGERVLVCDGAMGTMLYARGVFINKSFEALNLTDPDLVASVHQEYVRAGAEILETNTFGANRIKLGSFGLADKLHAINAEGARLARRVAGDDVYVAGSIGPLGIRIEPWGKTGVDEARQYFREQARALAEGGVDLFILETFRDLNEIGAAIDAVRDVSALPIVAQMTTEEDGSTLDGTPPERFAPELEKKGASLIGVNCAVGPAPMLDTIERMEAVTKLYLSAQPNAGRPRDVEGRNIYLSSPDYMASYARRFIAHHVRIVGGCCGTTPEHVRLMKAAVQGPPRGGQYREAAAIVSRFGGTVSPSIVSPPPVRREEKSRLAQSLAAGRFVVTVELTPGRGHDAEPLIARARALAAAGVDAVSIPDGHRGGARLSALALAVLIEQRAGIETVLHYSCRDRNLPGIQSDLLGAHAMGLRNLLLLTGDPVHAAEYPAATSVFDVDSIGLTNLAGRLNRGCDIGGQAIGAPTAFHVGVQVNPSAPDIVEELRRFDFKVRAGAEFVVTRPVFDVRALQDILPALRAAALPVLVSLVPFESARHAEFMANEVPGLRVPESLLARMRRAGEGPAAAAEGAAIARQLAEELRGSVQGLNVSVPGSRVETALRVFDGLR